MLRRGPKAYSLLVYLFVSESIMNITSAALSEILAAYEARIPKNSSKHAKIRKLMTLNDVKEALGDDGVARMEQKLCEIEKNRSSKKTKDTEPQGDETVMPETGLQSSCFCVTTWYANPRGMFEIKPPRNSITLYLVCLRTRRATTRTTRLWLLAASCSKS